MIGSNTMKLAPLGKRQIMAVAFSLLLLCAGSINGAQAASDSSSAVASSPKRSWLKEVPELIARGEVGKALDELKSQDQASDADWHNLMGFAYRKLQPPDFTRSEFHYKQALSIKPDHRGALEYYGELMLMKNNLAGAEDMLKRLEKACFFGCEELRDLKRAVEAYKRR